MSAADVTAILLSLGVLLASARILGELARRVGQPAILGEILAGLLLGPTVLGKFAPEVGAYLFAPSGSPGIFRSGLNQLSVTLFLLVAGMEIDLSAVHANRFEIFGVSNAKLPAAGPRRSCRVNSAGVSRSPSNIASHWPGAVR